MTGYSPAVRSLVLLVASVAAIAPADAGPAAIQAKLADSGGSGGTEAYRATVATKLERTYLAGIKRCHLQERKARADEVVSRRLVFSVDQKGAVTWGTTTFGKAAHACVVKAAKGWKLGVPQEADGAPAVAAFIVDIDFGSATALQASVLAALMTAEPASSSGLVGRAAENGLRDAVPTQLNGGLSAGGIPQTANPLVRIHDAQAFDASDLAANVVRNKVATAYLAGIRRCYKTRLAAAPNIYGRVVLSFTVNEKGLAVTTGARGFDGEVDSCIAESMKSWRFPIPHDSDGAPTIADFTLSLELSPA